MAKIPKLKNDTILIAVAIVVVVSVVLIIFLLDEAYIGNAIQDPVVMTDQPVELKTGYAQTMKDMVNSIADTNQQIVMGLFAGVGLALSFDKNHSKFSLPLKACILSLFAIAAISAIFFSFRFKLGFLLQVQYDSIDIESLKPTLYWSLCSLLGATLLCLLLLLVRLKPGSDDLS